MNKKVFYGLLIILAIFIPIRIADKYNIFMAEPNWGLLEKSQVDDETIEEAIDRLITAHDDNANSHIGAGKSLNTHKTQATVDHPADSVIEDKIPDENVTMPKMSFDKFLIHTNFESIDSWSITAGVSIPYMNQLTLETGAIINTRRMAYLGQGDANEDQAFIENNPYWETTVKFLRDTDQEAYIISGDVDIPEGQGFKIVDNAVSAWWIDSDGNPQTQVIGGINIREWNIYKIVVDSGVSVKFYINGVLKHTVTVKLAVGGFANFILYEIKNTAAVAKTMYVQGLIYREDHA